jgi:serine phosphatase RsbU (regulator of sigma subunit)/anti-sigma regulatory factor (Ser/Thr protein kinase)
MNLRNKWDAWRQKNDIPETPVEINLDLPAARARTINIEIQPEDPLLEYLTNVSGVVELEKVHLESPALEILRQEGIRITVPLVSQGELIGLLNLGSRLSEQDYSSDDKRLLTTLATQAAPALRVAQLAKQQQAEARQLERMEQELRVARVIQQTLLPQELPNIENWSIAAHWQPAREVSGDFYDFIEFPDGKLGIVIADVTDKGVPAALVMATTRSVLRSAAERLVSPGIVLERANNLICPDIPRNMFVTCLYIVLEPNAGKIWYANAGHNLPYKHTREGLVEFRASGMPLGLLPDMTYEEKEAQINAGETVVLYSDGLIEAHNPDREMYGFPRLKQFINENAGGPTIVQELLTSLEGFVGNEWEQEDDVTLVVIQNNALPAIPSPPADNRRIGWHILADFTIASEPGKERHATETVESTLATMKIPKPLLDKIKTSVSEATMNAMEHGSHYDPARPVHIRVYTQHNLLSIQVIDQGGGTPTHEPEEPDLEAKLEGEQSPRGWGLYLIKNLVDDLSVYNDGEWHIIDLGFSIPGDGEA